VEELMQVVSKGMRATQLYLPNNPVYQRAVENIRTAFRQIWQATDDLIFDIGETEMRWEDNVIYNQDQRNESIAWTLFKDGVRSLTFKPGVEDVEIVRFLGVLQHAKNLQADAPDDLLTLLWAEDFQFVSYTFRELVSENAVPIERTDLGAGPAEAARLAGTAARPIRRQSGDKSRRKRRPSARDSSRSMISIRPCTSSMTRRSSISTRKSGASTRRICAATCWRCSSTCSSSRPMGRCAPS